ncbi:MAG TPA: hypothetical protein VJR47_06430 [Stellaceae bacterium]|nr:hypothetical protein [Stellaceae bacterium]
MKGLSLADGRKLLAPVALGALLLSAATISAKADTDNITKTSTVPVPAISMSGGGGAGCTPTSFSFDISWVDPFVHVYLLADRTHGGASNGDIMMISIDAVNLTSPNTLSQGTTFLTPPAADPFAGIRCDQNAAFGGSAAAGRNEITGPNGVFTVNHVEAWAGDGPSPFAFGQTNKAADYVNDKCDSSVRVFNLVTGKQTDHINLHGCFRTDEGAFDPVDQLALFANPSEQPLPGNANAHALNASPFISLISTIPVMPGDHHKIVKQINFDGTHGTIAANGGIEQPVYVQDTGLFYIAVPGDAAHPDDGWITVVDPNADHHGDIRVMRNIPTPGCNPHGLAIGPDDKLFLGCNSGPEEVMDARSGHVLATLTQTAGGCDEVAFNAGDNHFVGACNDGAGPGQFGYDQVDADPIAVDQAKVPTAPGAHSIAADAVTVSSWIPAFGGAACTTGVACVAIYTSSGGDDKSVFAQLLLGNDHGHH